MNKINWALVIQARTGSTRLPNKMTLPFYENKSLLEIVIDNLLEVFPKEKIILATTTNNTDTVLVEMAVKKNISVFRGSENNVLERFTETAEYYNLTHIIRVCADNPFLLQEQLKQLSEIGCESSCDYVAYFFNNSLPSIKSHSGFFAEWVSVNALKKIMTLTSDKLYLEHVTNFIYSNPQKFTIQKIEMPEEDFCEKVRLTIDTKEDFEMSKNFYRILVNQKNNLMQSIKELVLSNPIYLEKMQMIIQQHTK